MWLHDSKVWGHPLLLGQARMIVEQPGHETGVPVISKDVHREDEALALSAGVGHL